jgi:hypothetical protein
MKRHNIIIALLAGLLLYLPMAVSQETAQMFHYTGRITPTVVDIDDDIDDTLEAILNAAIQRPAILSPLAIHANASSSAPDASEKDLLFADGGFEGDGQKTIPAKEGTLALIVCTILYAVMKRHGKSVWRSRRCR